MLHIPLQASEEERRRRLLNLLLVVTTLVVVLSMLVVFVSSSPGPIGEDGEILVIYIAGGVLLLSNAIVFAVNLFSPQLAAWIYLLTMLAAAVFSDAPEQTASGRTLIAIAIPVVIASILLRPYVSLVIAGLGSLAVCAVGLRVGVMPAPGTAGLFFVALVSALMARSLERTLADLRLVNKNLALLNQASRELGSILDLDEVLVRVLDEVRTLLGVVACSVWLVDPGTDELVCRQASGPEQDLVRGWRIKAGEGLVGWTASSGESLLVADVYADERYFPKVAEETGLNLRSILSIPLQARHGTVGVLQAVDAVVGRFTEEHLELLEPLAATAAVAIENARLYSEEQQRATALKQALDQQKELDRLKSEFIQNFSHELRTPLALIQGYADLMEGGELGELASNQREAISVISRRSRMLTKLVDDLFIILIVEEQGPRKDPVDLAALVQEMMVDFQVSAQRAGLTLTSEILASPAWVTGDIEHLSRVLDNLVNNALKFTPAGGSVTVSLMRDEGDLVLEVTDTGIGIPKDRLDYVFDRFYQVDGSMTRKFGGAGLGLALVKEVVEAHGGQVSVESEYGKGSSFRVTLPGGF
jgi:signal transduction histidine kinase